MKGILICGGSGTRLRPLTEITNKSLLPVYDKPLILYPLQTLRDAGIMEIMVISGPEHIDQMSAFLGSGYRFGCSFSYRVQDEPRGIAHALSMAKSFTNGENVCAILGDNVYFDDLSKPICSFIKGGHVFLKKVSDPGRFGVVEIDTDRVISIEEKPHKPRSNLAQTGCYVFDHRCFEAIETMQPSTRDEYEITDVARWYMDRGELRFTLLADEWVDAGTFESLHYASTLVRARHREKHTAPRSSSSRTSRRMQSQPKKTPVVL